MRLIPQHNVFRIMTYFAIVWVANYEAYTFLWRMPDKAESGAPTGHMVSMAFSTLCTLTIPVLFCCSFSHETYKQLRSRNQKRYGLFFKIIVIVKCCFTVITLNTVALFFYGLSLSELRFLGCSFVSFPCVVFAIFFMLITGTVLVLFLEFCTSAFCQCLLATPKVCSVLCRKIGLN